MFDNSMPAILTDSDLMVKTPSVFCFTRGPKTTAKYKHINTLDVINKFRESGWEVMGAKQKRSRGLNSSDKALFTQHEITLRPANIDPTINTEYIPTLRIVNSHNTESSLRIYLGVFRFICSNGLVVASSVFANSRLLHKETVTDRIGAEIKRIQEAVPVLSKYLVDMSGVQLTPAQQLEYAVFALSLRYPDQSNKKHVIDTASLLVTRRDADKGNDLWTVFNRVQENLLSGGRNRIRRVTAIAKDIELNQALFAKAMEYLPKQAL